MQPRYSIQVRILMRVLAGAALIATVIFGVISRVDAKGPESVVITGPEFDQPIELMDTADIDLMSRLMEQSGIWYGTGDLPKPLAKQPGELGPAYTLTWVNGGPPGKSVAERTIRQFIYLDAERGPMIHTPAQETLENWGPGVIGWFHSV